MADQAIFCRSCKQVILSSIQTSDDSAMIAFGQYSIYCPVCNIYYHCNTKEGLFVGQFKIPIIFNLGEMTESGLT